MAVLLRTNFIYMMFFYLMLYIALSNPPSGLLRFSFEPLIATDSFFYVTILHTTRSVLSLNQSSYPVLFNQPKIAFP